MLRTLSQIMQNSPWPAVFLTAVLAIFLIAGHIRPVGPIFQIPAPVDNESWVRPVLCGSIVPDENDPQQIPAAPPLELMIH